MAEGDRGFQVPVEAITHAILELRGQRVILDSELAALYGVPTKALNQAVKRNTERFPDGSDRTRPVTNCDRFPPSAFTEHGAIMAATILNSPRAVEMSIYVVRAFVQLRGLIASNQEFALRLDQLEARIEKKLATHDDAIAAMLSAIRELMKPQPVNHRGIGFTADISHPK